MTHTELNSWLHQISIEHREDVDGGYAFVRDLRNNIKTMDSASRDSLIQILVDLVIQQEPTLWGVALESLVQENVSVIAAKLESVLRAGGQQIIWREQVILGLLRLGWNGAIDVYLSHIRLMLAEERLTTLPLLAALCRVDPQACVEIAAEYLSQMLIRKDQIQRIEGYIPAFVRYFIETDPALISQLMKKTNAISSIAGQRLGFLFDTYLSKPFVIKEYGEEAIESIHEELKSMISLRSTH